MLSLFALCVLRSCCALSLFVVVQRFLGWCGVVCCLLFLLSLLLLVWCCRGFGVACVLLVVYCLLDVVCCVLLVFCLCW